MTTASAGLLRGALLGATCLSGVLLAGPALAGAAPSASEHPNVIATGVTGIGQVVVSNGPAAGTLNLCTGTLINPRTVLFAAHCVNGRPAAAYGADAGTLPVSVGFAADNQAAVRQWLGLDGGLSAGLRHRTNPAQSLYAVEQVWYDPRSHGPGSGGFMAADIALATLDAPAFDVPSWALLFSPLAAPTHATISGYGGGVAGVNWRRAAAENMISTLGSFDDRSRALYGTAHPLGNNLYMVSFTDPNPRYDPAAGKFDFGILGDRALPGEGGASGGDSGGPLIVDQKFGRPVVAGVLSGVDRYFANQQFSDYGTLSFYQPLHLYWDAIAANNSYMYAGNRAGQGDWEDPSHWVRRLDPGYLIEIDGKLVNALPDSPAQGTAAGGAKFGSFCFLSTCTTLDGAAHTSGGAADRGPEPLGFVPNNVKASPSQAIKARYFDVTLSAPGTTRLSSAVAVDRMTVDGPTALDIREGGSLRVLGEYKQLSGSTHVDGRLASDRDMLFASGLLSGSGIVRAPFLTVVGGAVAPGGVGRSGTLAIEGDVILSSASSLLIDIGAGRADRLAVNGSLSLSDAASSGGTLLLGQAIGQAAPRHGDSHVIASASAGVEGTFGATLHGFRGVLRPELRYGANEVTLDFRAQSLTGFLKGRGATELAFAGALDAMRERAHDRLPRLYGAVDMMDADAAARTLRDMAPTPAADEALALGRRQSRLLLDTIGERFASLGSGDAAGRLAVAGSADAALVLAGSRQPGHLFAATFASSARLQSEAGPRQRLPEHLSGFVSGSVDRRESRIGGERGPDTGQRAWHFGMGLETAVSDKLTVGTAFGYSEGASTPSGGALEARSKVGQIAVYGAYRLPAGAYLAGIAAAERGQGGMKRQAWIADAETHLQGRVESSRYSASLEAGMSIALMPGLEIAPRAQLGYERLRSGAYRETGGEIALNVEALDRGRLDARLGARLAGAAAIGGGWTIAPQARLDWVRRLSGRAGHLQVRFVNAADLPIALPLAVDEPSEVEVGGLVRLARKSLELSLGGKTSLGRQGLRDDRAVADLLLRF